MGVMKFETILSAYKDASENEALFIQYAIECYRAKDKATAYKYERNANRYSRQSAAFRARLLSMYSLDTIRRLEQSRDSWLKRAYIAENENIQLRQQLEELENAWAVDETIQPDGSLRPSLADTVKRTAELEAENARLRQEREGG